MIKKESFKRESYQNDDDVHDFLHITQVLPFYEITMAKTNLTVRFLTKNFEDTLRIVVSIWSWNFKDGGSLKASILPKNQHAERKF